jgi:hypothetical protein
LSPATGGVTVVIVELWWIATFAVVLIKLPHSVWLTLFPTVTLPTAVWPYPALLLPTDHTVFNLFATLLIFALTKVTL